VVKKAQAGGDNEHSFDEVAFLTPLRQLISKVVALPCDVFVQGAEGCPETKCKSQPGKPGFDYI
jgi:hypothetical protein